MMSQLYMNGERGSIEQNVYNKCKVKQLWSELWPTEQQ
jgi:hypothetical protein